MNKLFILLSFILLANMAPAQDLTDFADSVTVLKSGYKLIDKITDTIEYFYLQNNQKRVELDKEPYGILIGGIAADGSNYFMMVMSTRSFLCPSIFLTIYSKKEMVSVYTSQGYILDNDTLRSKVAFYDTSGSFVVYNLNNNTYTSYHLPGDVHYPDNCPLPDFENTKLSDSTLEVHYTDTMQHAKVATYPLWKLPETKY